MGIGNSVSIALRPALHCICTYFQGAQGAHRRGGEVSGSHVRAVHYEAYIWPETRCLANQGYAEQLAISRGVDQFNIGCDSTTLTVVNLDSHKVVGLQPYQVCQLCWS